MRRGGDTRYARRERDTAEPRERRRGQSRLANWGLRELALALLGWVGVLLMLLLVGAALSESLHHGDTEIREALTRSNITGLVLVTVAPPLCLLLQWWTMQGRRKAAHRRSDAAQITQRPDETRECHDRGGV